MKKLTVLSIVAASLLLVGCGDSATGAEAKAAASTAVEKTKEAASTTVEKTKEAVAEKATEVKDAVAEKAASATAAVAATATAAVESTKEAASAAVEKTKEAASAAVEKTKEAASAVAEKATEAKDAAKDAVASATGPDGKALFAKCAGCHGADGKTAALGKSEIIAGQAAADLETKINGYKAGTLNTKGMGALMKGQVATYSDEDIKAVAAFISGL